jgi:hypothetical protein
MLHTASETVTSARWRHREGRPCFRTDSMSVGRWAHAYREGLEVTLCALPLDLLYWKQFRTLDFEEVAQGDRCRSCATFAGLA